MEDRLFFSLVNEQNKAKTRELLTEYGHYLFDELKLMAGRESFFKELKSFPDEKYQKPSGAFYIVYLQDEPIGCLGFKQWTADECELKRMYIRQAFRGRGFSYAMILFILKAAKNAGYKTVLLDTNTEMEAACKAYLNTGFQVINPYCDNENANPVFLSYDLTSLKA